MTSRPSRIREARPWWRRPGTYLIFWSLLLGMNLLWWLTGVSTDTVDYLAGLVFAANAGAAIQEWIDNS